MVLDLGAESQGQSLLDVLRVLGATEPSERNVLLVVIAAVLEGVVDDIPLSTIVSIRVISPLEEDKNSPPSHPGSRRTAEQFRRRFHEG